MRFVMRYFPFFFNLRGARVLVVGGGGVAARKAALLARAGARLRVAAPDIRPQLAELVRASGGELRARAYRKTDLRGCRVAVAAAGLAPLNRRIRRDAQAAGVPLNVVDQPELCDFIFPAFADRDPVCVAVSSGGASPVLARMLRNRAEAELPANFGALAVFCEKHRPRVQCALPEKIRRRFWEAVLRPGPLVSAVLNGDDAQADALLQQALDQFNSGANPNTDSSSDSGANSLSDFRAGGEAYLIGAGPGDPELMTFKAQRLLQQADVVFYDRLVARDIVDLARRDAEKIFVGKTRARKTFSQADINAMLIRRARAGERVARLKGGDPFVFGRGGEEAEALAAAGIPVQIVPGVSAANGAAAAAGIPLTHRDIARAVRLETAYREDMMSPARWRRLARDEQATLVFYMAGASLSAVADNLVLGGKPPGAPVAVVCGGATPAQKVIRGTLGNIAQRAAGQLFSPALIIVGEVVNISLQNFAADNNSVDNDNALPFFQIA